MATLDTLASDDGPLTLVTVPLGRFEAQKRWIYAFPEVVAWMQNDLPNLTTGRSASAFTPQEQLFDLFHRWIAGKAIVYDRVFKDLMPQRDEVWEMKTADIRLFGWMADRLRFVAVLPGYADHYKGLRPRLSYENARTRVIYARNALDLDEPKFKTGSFDALVAV